jgi:hypothetical protein
MKYDSEEYRKFEQERVAAGQHAVKLLDAGEPQSAGGASTQCRSIDDQQVGACGGFQGRE